MKGALRTFQQGWLKGDEKVENIRTVVLCRQMVCPDHSLVTRQEQNLEFVQGMQIQYLTGKMLIYLSLDWRPCYCRQRRQRRQRRQLKIQIPYMIYCTYAFKQLWLHTINILSIISQSRLQPGHQSGRSPDLRLPGHLAISRLGNGRTCHVSGVSVTSYLSSATIMSAARHAVAFIYGHKALKDSG